MTQQHTNTAQDVWGTGPSVFNGGAFPQSAYGAVTNNNPGSDDPYIGYYPLLQIANYVPATLGANLIATAQAPATGVALTLTAGTGITLSGGNYYIDGVPAANPTTDRTKTGTRSVSATGVSGGSGGTILITGLDLYGNTITQLITLAAGVNTVNTTKAFKAVTSVVPNFTDASHNISIGIGDVYGFGLYSSVFSDTLITWNGAVITSATGYLAGVTTVPSTNLLGDTRGTYATQSASDATKRLVIAQYPAAYSGSTFLGVTPV